MHNDLVRGWSCGHWTPLHVTKYVTFLRHRASLMFIFVTKWAVMNKIIEIQRIQCPFKLNAGIFIDFIARIMLFICIFSTFYENLHNVWMRNYFHIKFGGLMSNYLLYMPWKFETKILIFGRVIENSLGGYFFLAHSVFVALFIM